MKEPSNRSKVLYKLIQDGTYVSVSQFDKTLKEYNNWQMGISEAIRKILKDDEFYKGFLELSRSKYYKNTNE